MNRKNELLIKVLERYTYHKNYLTDNPFVKDIAEQMCAVEIAEMWMLTQQSGVKRQCICCGAFGNDAENMARLFSEEIRGFSVSGPDDHGKYTAKDFFNRIEYAVLNRTKEQYNYRSFCKYFEDFYGNENTKECELIDKLAYANENWLDGLYGCLIGGAAGDALGYPVEFMSWHEILRKYGSGGIEDYELVGGKALISDDTQMTLFTATGLLDGSTGGVLKERIGDLPEYIWRSYETWYRMQTGKSIHSSREADSWLWAVPEMSASRAPGNTCLSALGGNCPGTVSKPLNDSKGCGGIMRVAPIGLYLNRYPQEQDFIGLVDRLGADVAALTHGHELGYLPAVVLVHIINRIIYGGFYNSEEVQDKYGKAAQLEMIVQESLGYLRKLYGTKRHTEELCRLVEKAIVLSKNDLPNPDNIRQLGQGWVAEETLAIAIYCSLKYPRDISKALCASVNHDGDSDSTGAVTGNIVGVLVGFWRIPLKWKETLECADVIREIALDLCHGVLMSEYSDYRDKQWVEKYVDHFDRRRKRQL